MTLLNHIWLDPIIYFVRLYLVIIQFGSLLLHLIGWEILQIDSKFYDFF